jgi:hypothetical protein
VDSLILPVLTDDHTIDVALERMVRADSRAIVIQHFSEQFVGERTVRMPDGYILYMNQAVADAWKLEEPTCAKLRAYKGEAVPVLDPFSVPATVGSMAQLIERQLDELHAMLGILVPPRPDDDTMMVVTRHEWKRDEVAMAGQVCGCGGSIRHVASSPPATTGGSCVVCGAVYTCW